MTAIAQRTMRALTTTFGAESALTAAELPIPEPGFTEIRVAVHAAGVNPVDWKSRASGGFGLWEDDAILGWDVAGVVDAVGPGVTLYAPGDRVFGMPSFPQQAGAYAEHVVAPARRFAPTPANLSDEEAAALPLAGLTAWQALTETARLQPGERVLVHAAAGGVGHLAVQIAKARGATVIGTASARNAAFVRNLGADAVIDHRSVAFERETSDIDVVLDAIGGDYARRSLEVLRDGGRLVSLTGPAEPGPDVDAVAAKRGIRTGWTLVEPDRAGMLALAALAAEGRLRAHVAATFALADADAAHGAGATGRTAGKIVLRVRG